MVITNLRHNINLKIKKLLFFNLLKKLLLLNLKLIIHINFNYNIYFLNFKF